MMICRMTNLSTVKTLAILPIARILFLMISLRLAEACSSMSSSSEVSSSSVQIFNTFTSISVTERIRTCFGKMKLRESLVNIANRSLDDARLKHFKVGIQIQTAIYFITKIFVLCRDKYLKVSVHYIRCLALFAILCKSRKAEILYCLFQIYPKSIFIEPISD